ncbi:MAG: hypothetical protein ABIH71_02915 [Candidatus Omnitrophota bacterium]|nr:hypothetical protein [Candidatus Omnitrophota bacterium]
MMDKSVTMKCRICGREKEKDKIVILSERAYAQIGSLLKDGEEFKNKVGVDDKSAVYVCKLCFLSAYKPQKAFVPAV